ncbi:MAG: choice-of-anchor tandem repeat GloVer-containing protein [Bacteroidia bacterium]
MKTFKLIIALLSVTLIGNAQYNKIVDFAGINGQNPAGSLISDGTFLYGMTSGGGINNSCTFGGCGVLFKIKPDGTAYSKLLDFDNTTIGSSPQGSLFFDGVFLYGMTRDGGTNNNGIVFKIKPDSTGYAQLHNFSGSDGSRPYGSLISDSVFLYGTTSMGGANNFGTIFKIKPDGTNYSVLHNCDSASGITPGGDLFYDGTFLYGMTGSGGANNMGVIFKIKPDGTGYTKLLDFDGTNGKKPFYNSFVFDGTFLYGMTGYGGANNMGVIFKIKGDGTGYSKLLDFSGVSNGNSPAGTLVSSGSFLYGTTCLGGVNNKGVVFKIKPDGTNYSKLLDFDGQTNGSNPFSGSLIFDSTSFYGMTSSGGTYNYGVIYNYNLVTTGIKTLSGDLQIDIFPNPMNEVLTIRFSEPQLNSSLKIVDVLGREVKSTIINGQELTIMRDDLVTGVYTIQVENKSVLKLRRKIIVN